MKAILRLLWLIGYIPMLILLCILSVFSSVFYLLLCMFYFVKTGSLENMPYDFLEPICCIEYEYFNLLEKIND